jgi:hypothetical protein
VTGATTASRICGSSALTVTQPQRLTVAGAKVGGPRLLPCGSW